VGQGGRGMALVLGRMWRSGGRHPHTTAGLTAAPKWRAHRTGCSTCWLPAHGRDSAADLHRRPWAVRQAGHQVLPRGPQGGGGCSKHRRISCGRDSRCGVAIRPPVRSQTAPPPLTCTGLLACSGCLPFSQLLLCQYAERLWQLLQVPVAAAATVVLGR